MNAAPLFEAPLLKARGLALRFGPVVALDQVTLDIWPGEVLAILGESGSGKTTLLRVLAGQLAPEAGTVSYGDAEGRAHDVHGMEEGERRRFARTEWGFVHQSPRDGLRLGISAGGNVGERLMAAGWRHFGRIRDEAASWLAKVEIDPARIDDRPAVFSGGMQQRLQIARTLVTRPRLVLMDEPTGGLDVSVQARLLDLLRGLVAELGIGVVIVTHDIGVARLLAHRLLIMRHGRVVEAGATDRVLDDPQHPYTQLLVASVLAA